MKAYDLVCTVCNNDDPNKFAMVTVEDDARHPRLVYVKGWRCLVCGYVSKEDS